MTDKELKSKKTELIDELLTSLDACVKRDCV